MPLEAGTKLGRYEILSLIGTGGMGEVYLAEDPRLGRKVALKLLTEVAATDDDSRRRFGQEARSASSLNHPNIITIYEVAEWEGTDYIAMELVQGESVREMIASKGRVRLHEALNIAIQVASALAAAHEAGIVHRDIKPENIIRRPDGLVKVLDFGLAKQTATVSDSFRIDSEASTYAPAETLPGMVMGTIPYMSPEQARGKPVDARTDIWSLGAVLYEMITGATPFGGETRSDLLVAILTKDPDPLAVRTPEASREIDDVVRKALVKDREGRYQSANELQLDLKIILSDLNSGAFQTEVLSRTTTGEPAAGTVNTIRSAVDRPGHGILRSVAVSFAVLAVAALGFWYFGGARPNEDARYLRSLESVQLASWKSVIGESDVSPPKYSPDGRLIAYVAFKDGRSAIWLKQLDGGEPFTRKQDDGNDSSPVWSPNGQKIAYYSNRGGRRAIWSMPALGGQPELEGDVPGRARPVRWSNDGSKIFYELNATNLYVLDTSNGQSSKLTDFDDGTAINRQFCISSDEKQIAFSDTREGQNDLWIAEINAANRKRLTNDAFIDGSPVWHPDGRRIIYTSERNGIRQMFLAYADASEPLQMTLADSDLSVADISKDGRQILYTSSKDDSDIWGVNLANSREMQLTSDIGPEFWPDASPQGSAVVYQAVGRTSIGTKLLTTALYAQQFADGSRRTQIAPDGFHAQWSPDGRSIAFLRTESGTNSLWIASPDGGDARRLTQSGVFFGGWTKLPYNRIETRDFAWAPDSRSIIYAAVREGSANIWRADVEGGAETPLTRNSERGLFYFGPSIAPDGSGIAWAEMRGDQDKRNWAVWLLHDNEPRQVHQSATPIRVLGWSESGDGLIVQSVPSALEGRMRPSEVVISEIARTAEEKPRELAKLENVYPLSIVLSPDRRSAAFTVSGEGGDEIRILSLRGGTPRKFNASNDPRVYFSNLSYSPDGKMILFGKQANWQVISAINNFK